MMKDKYDETAERVQSDIIEHRRISRKREFTKVLAGFLAGDQVAKSIWLQMGKPLAQEWANLRASTPLSGYPTVKEAEQLLKEFLR